MPERKQNNAGRENRFRILAYIDQFQAERTISPSLREIAEGCHFDKSGIYYHVGILEAQGHVSFAHSPTTGRRLARTLTRHGPARGYFQPIIGGNG